MKQITVRKDMPATRLLSEAVIASGEAVWTNGDYHVTVTALMRNHRVTGYATTIRVWQPGAGYRILYESTLKDVPQVIKALSPLALVQGPEGWHPASSIWHARLPRVS